MTGQAAAGARVPVLAAASFATATQSFVFAGLLAEMAEDLGASVAQVGQLATAYALAFAVAAPALAALLARHDRRRVIVGGLLLLAVLNLVIVLAQGFPAILSLRVAAGIAAAAVVPAASAAAFALAPPERRGRAMALVIGGTTAAFLLGIPLGSVVGEVFGWRGCFAFAAVLALAAALAIAGAVPPVPGDGGRTGGGLAALRLPGVARMLLLSLAGFAAVFSIAAYIGPVTNRVSGLTGGGVGAVQALVGVASLAGLPIGARMADRGGAGAAWLPAAILGANLLQAALLAGLAEGSGFGLPLQALSVLVSAGALFALATVVSARLATLAPEARGFVMACNGSAVFLGQAAGAALGGAGIALLGLAGAGIAGTLAALPAFWLASALRRPGGS